MSVRRFAAYFFAVTAGSTAVFASFLIAPGAATSETVSREASSDMAAIPEMARLFQRIEERQHHRMGMKRPQIALADYPTGN